MKCCGEPQAQHQPPHRGTAKHTRLSTPMCTLTGGLGRLVWALEMSHRHPKILPLPPSPVNFPFPAPALQTWLDAGRARSDPQPARGTGTSFPKISRTGGFWPFALAHPLGRWPQDAAQVGKQLPHAQNPPFSLFFPAREGLISTKSMATRPAASEPAPRSLPSSGSLCLLLAHPSSPHFLLSWILEGAASLFSSSLGRAGWGTGDSGFPLNL